MRRNNDTGRGKVFKKRRFIILGILLFSILGAALLTAWSGGFFLSARPALVKKGYGQGMALAEKELLLAGGNDDFGFNPDHFTFTDHSMMVERLDSLTAVSGGRVGLEIIGQSNLGKDIYMASVGGGDIPVFIFAQIHGYERTSSEASLKLLEKLGTCNSPAVTNILEQLTVYIVPKVNIDGGEPDVLTYANVDPTVPPRCDEMGIYSDYGDGWRLHSFHAPNWDDHPLSNYEEPALVTDRHGFIAGKAFDGSPGYEGLAGQVIDCGPGTDFPPAVDGQIALVERGGGTFDAVVQRAFEAGASAVVFYQDQVYQPDDQDNFLPRFSLTPPSAIPVMAVARPEALRMAADSEPVFAEIIKNAYPENPAVETQALIDAILRVDPLWLMDAHNHRGTIGVNGKTTTAAVMWSNCPDAPAEVVEMGKQLSMAMSDSVMEKYDFVDVTRYSTNTHPFNSRNGYAHLGIASVLLELWLDQAPPYADMITNLGFEKMFAALEKTADGTLFEIDPDRVSELAPWGPRVSHTEARNNIAPLYMSYLYPEELKKAAEVISALPPADDITLASLEQVEAARLLILQNLNRGVPKSIIENMNEFEAVEEAIGNYYRGEWFDRISLLALGDPGAANRSGLSYFVDPGRWSTGHTINGISYDPLEKYVYSHVNIDMPRWIEYDISGRGFDFIEGYAGIVDTTTNNMRPLDFIIFTDGEPVFEAHLQHMRDAVFYRLDLSGVEKIRFQWSARYVTRNRYANRIAVVEPVFLSFDASRAAAAAGDAISALPQEITMKERKAVKKARSLVDGAVAHGVDPGDLSGLPVLTSAEEIIAGLEADAREEAVYEAVAAIESLPGEITYADKAAVEEARSLVDYAFSLGAGNADIPNLDTLLAAEDTIEVLDQGAAGRVAYITAAVEAIENLPSMITLVVEESVMEARGLVREALARGAETGDLANLNRLEGAEMAIIDLKSALYDKISLFVLDDPGDYLANLAWIVDYETRWRTGYTIDGISYDPRAMFTAGYRNLHVTPRWVEYEIKGRGFDSVEGYLGVPDFSPLQDFPLDFKIFVDGTLAFEAYLEYGKDAFHYLLDLRGVEKLMFKWSAREVAGNEHANRPGFVEPQFNTFPADNGKSAVEAAISALPAELTLTEREGVSRVRYLVNSALSIGVPEGEIANLGELVEAENTIAALEEELGLYGDLDGDGSVNIRDVILLLRHITGQTDLEQIYGDGTLIRARVGAYEGEPGISDAVHIMRYLLGMINRFPVEDYWQVKYYGID